MLFVRSDKIPRARFDSTGRLIKRGMPVEISPPTPGSAEDISEKLWDKGKRVSREEIYPDVPGAAADLAAKISSAEEGVRELPSGHFVNSMDEERRLYTKSALIGVMGGYL